MREALGSGAAEAVRWPARIRWWAPWWCATAKWWAAASTPGRACEHAEVVALAEAGDQARGATLYVNLEPCSHQGRTPPCADALIAAGVARGGGAAGRSQSAGGAARAFASCALPASKWRSAPEFAAEAAKLNEPFLHFMRTGRPLVTLKAAITLDGKISAPDDNRGWITSERARAHVQELRHDHDAILTGIGTVLADDLPAHRPHRPAAQPPAAAHRDGFAAAPAARFEDGPQRRRAIWWWSTTSASSAERRARSKPAASRCWCSTGRAAAPILRALIALAGRAALSFADDRSRQQIELDRARIRSGGSHLLLLRAQDSGRPGGAAPGRRHRAPAPRGRHPPARS